MTSGTSTDLAVLEMSPDSVRAISELRDQVARLYPSADSPAFLREAARFAHALPEDLREAVLHYANDERESALLVRGLPIEPVPFGPTPLHWNQVADDAAWRPTRYAEFVQILIASLVGQPFSYATLQGGRLFHHLLPIPGHEKEQNGHSSDDELVWHSEDAFTDARCDHLALLGMRNADGVGTLFAPVTALYGLQPRDIEILSQPRFVVRADNEHLKNVGVAHRTDITSIHDVLGERRTSILSGGPQLPYLVIDKAFMAAQPDDVEAAEAFAHAVQALDAAVREVIINAHDLMLIDNRRAVHGRSRFAARYDGTDRWLMKVSITTDLTRSRPYRTAATSRMVW